MAIPKIIHYCWFGRGEKTKLIKKCIKSWKKYCPDYQIIEWNEDNFDINCCDYVREAYDSKKWAFVTDYARLKILYEHGGIYLDTDVELVKSLDEFLGLKAFMGIEQEPEREKQEVATGLATGSVPGHPVILEMMRDYETAHFRMIDGSLDLTTCTVRNTAILAKYGFNYKNEKQTVVGVTIFPWDYFCPMYRETHLVHKTKNTVAIHRYGLSWTPIEHQREREKRIHRQNRERVIHYVIHLPNLLARKLLGKERYERIKVRLR